jgi:hypothetical protein
MTKVIKDKFGERMEATANDSTEREKELRSQINCTNL